MVASQRSLFGGRGRADRLATCALGVGCCGHVVGLAACGGRTTAAGPWRIGSPKACAAVHLGDNLRQCRVLDGARRFQCIDVSPLCAGAICEQIRRLRDLNIGFEIAPDVPAFAAAAALLKTELTLLDVSQTVILTRTAMPNEAGVHGLPARFCRS